ncbi:MAG: hypothetical protein LC099_01465 [Anaerolineales bacterium]|nr:hypothetical protein [Anaerolineales bacterium]
MTTFRPPSKSYSFRDYLFIAAVAIFIVAVSVGLWRANQNLPAGGGDFLRQWAGGRAFIFDRADPYSAYVPNQTQKLVYAGKASAGENPYILETPFHLLLLYFPFALFSDAPLARAVFTLIVEWALFALIYLSLRLSADEIPRWLALLFFLAAALNLYAFQALTAASPILFLGLSCAAILLALRHEQDEFAGALIALSLYHWEALFLFLLFIAWMVYKQKRARVLVGFGMLTFVLLLASFLIYPNWLIPYFRAAANALQADFGFSIFSALTVFFPAYGRQLGWVVIAILFLALGYEWNAAAEDNDPRRFYWTACLSLAAAPLFGFRGEIANLVLLIIPFALIISVVRDRWARFGALWIVLFLLAFVLAPWALYLFAFPFSSALVYLFFPVFCLLGLYWIRWWTLRPPRIWADSLPR